VGKLGAAKQQSCGSGQTAICRVTQGEVCFMSHCTNPTPAGTSEFSRAQTHTPTTQQNNPLCGQLVQHVP